MKTFDKKDVYSWSNAEDAKQYIGKEGYFSNNFSALKIKVKNCDELNMLKNIDSYGICCFNPNEHFEGFGLFLPADKIKEIEEPKYRPFRTTEEFSKVTGKRIGSILKFRCGGNDKRYYTRMYTGFHILENGNIYIELGSEAYNLEQLYNYYEYLDEHGDWKPFGVEE